MKAKTILQLSIVISTLLIQATFAALPRYEIIDLGTLGGDQSGASFVNDRGQIVGSAYNQHGERRATLFDSTGNGNNIDLGTLGGTNSWVWSINNSGQIVGDAENDLGYGRATLFDPTGGGSNIDLGTLGGDDSLAISINDSGQIVGAARNGQGYQRATLFDPTGGGNNIDLGTLGGIYSQAWFINDRGQIVGKAQIPRGYWPATLFDPTGGGNNIDLGTLGGSSSNVHSINNRGQIVGWAATDWLDNRATLFDPTGGGNNIELSTLGGRLSWALSINDLGQIVGAAEDQLRDARATLFDPTGNGKNIDLNTIVNPGSGWILTNAFCINNHGWIVGNKFNQEGKGRAFLMKPLPRRIYVDDDATGANDGSSWADAFNYLQDALTVAWGGDEIRVAQGTYKPDQGVVVTPGDREATFHLINGVTIKGGYAGADAPDPNARDIELYETILSGDLNDDDGPNFTNNNENSYHVVTAVDTEERTVLDGFTITGGCANGEGWPLCLNCGGGIYSYSGSPTVMNCTITRNTAGVGGGVSFRGQRHFLDVSVIKNNIITENTAVDGGGIYCSGAPTIADNIITKNIAVNGGGIYCYEGGMIANNTIEKNTAQCGGGIFTWEDYAPTIINNIISENWAQEEGGGIGTHDNSPTIIGNLIIGNATAGNGGGIYLQSALSEEIANNTIAGNKAVTGGGICTYIVSMKVTNCILWGNTADIGPQIAMKTIDPGHRFSILTVNYSDILGGAAEIYVGGAGSLNWGEGNIDADPLFVQPGYWNAKYTWIDGDYHLLPGSPCIDAGDPNYIAGPNKTDLDGRPRVIGDRIDMGAYETPIFAEARILPRTINLASKGKWITCYIWFSDDYDVTDINPGSVLLERQIKAEQFSVDEQKQVATATFDREKVQSILNIGDIELTITCQLADGTYFEATDIIQVTDKSSSK